MGPETKEQSTDVQGDVPSGRKSSFGSDIQTIPNLMSLSRIVMILASAILYLNDYRPVALVLGIVAGVTDILDGWIARKLNQTTDLGAILDRLSDLVMETVAFTCLLHYNLIPPVFFIIYMVREFFVGAARLYVAEKGEVISSSFFGKVKTDLVLGSFIGLFATHSGLITGSESGVIWKIGYGLMVGGLVCSYISGVQYMRTFGRLYTQR